MFFKKQTPPSTEVMWSADPPARSPSPSPSIAPSLAPSTISSQSLSSFLSGFTRHDSTASSIATPTPSTPPKPGLGINEMPLELHRLQAQCSQWEQQSKLNQDMLHSCAALLQEKEEECDDLERDNKALNDVLDAMTGLNKTLKQSVVEKDCELHRVSEKLEVSEGINDLRAKECADARLEVKDALERVREWKRACAGKNEKMARLRLDNVRLRSHIDTLEGAKDQAVEEAAGYEKQATALGVENEVLAARVVVLEQAVQDSSKLIDCIQKQHQTLLQSHNQQQEEYDKIVEAILAQKGQERQDSKNRIQCLMGTMKDQEDELTRATSAAAHSEGEKDAEIADLKEQLRRMQLDLADQATQVDL